MLGSGMLGGCDVLGCGARSEAGAILAAAGLWWLISFNLIKLIVFINFSK
jgi:hypothetical protein